MQEECNKCRNDSHACSCDTDAVENKCGIHSYVECIDAILNLRRKVEVAEVDVEAADFKFLVELLGNVEMVYN